VIRVAWASCAPGLAAQRAAARKLAASVGVAVRAPGVSHAHSGGVVLLVVDEDGGTVGADVERLAGRRVLPSVLTQRERAWVGEDVVAFVRCWVAKEAAVKALGGGFAGVGGPPAVEVPPPAAHGAPVGLGGAAAGLWARWIAAPDGYIAAVVSPRCDLISLSEINSQLGAQSPEPSADCS